MAAPGPESDRKFDIVVFGATGFTGQFVVEEIARTIDEEDGIKWAIAGRNMSKLQSVLKEASKYTGMDLSETPILIADVASETSLTEMCQQARIILNCVGPYQLYGEPVVKACVENKTHHIDICGEPVFLEDIQLRYHQAAKEAGVYVMESCGFDSIPADLGMVYIRKIFPGDLNHVEGYLSLNIGPDGGKGNVGTWMSAVHGFANAGKLKSIRKSMALKRLPRGNFKMPKRSTVFYSDETNGWCIPFVGADRSIVNRTQRFNYDENQERPILFNAYMRLTSLFAVVFFMLMGLVFGIFSQFKFGQNLLLNYPGIMSLGMFSTTGPTRKQLEGSSFTMNLLGEGHKEKIDDLEKQHDDKPTEKVKVKVTGPEIGYITTPICMVQAAYTLLKEMDNCPDKGGVYTPGAAFSRTGLIERLTKHGVKFETQN